jgi:V8-like Glu-specific endopeptidase
MRNSIGTIKFAALAAICSASGAVMAAQNGPAIIRVDEKQVPLIQPRIVNGTPTTWYPAIGALLYRKANTPFGSWCTATLIGCSTILTAAHCVAKDDNVSNYKVFLQHGGLFNITGKIQFQRDKYISPDDGGGGSNADVAVLTLAEPAEGIAPLQISDDHEHVPGLKGTIVGYGVTRGSAMDYGLKRFGYVVASACPVYEQKRDLVCWHFQNGPTSDTCSGDSGGPLLRSDDETIVSGVTSGGNASCQPPDDAFDASVFRNNSWIKSAAGANLRHAACGSVAPLQNAKERYRWFSGQLNNDQPQHVYEVQITNARQLRVGANLGKPINVGLDHLVTQPQLYIVKGSSTSIDGAACSSAVEAQAAFCALDTPTDGTYSVILMRGVADRVADFQLTISVF